MKEMKSFNSYGEKNHETASKVKEAVVNILGIPKEDYIYQRIVGDVFVDKYADYITGNKVKDIIGNVSTIENELPHYIIYPYSGAGCLCDPISMDTLDEVIECVEEMSYTCDFVRSQMEIYDVKTMKSIGCKVDQYIDFDRDRYSVVNYQNDNLRFSTNYIEKAKEEARRWVEEAKGTSHEGDVVYVCDRTKEYNNEIWAVADDGEGYTYEDDDTDE